MIKIGCCMPGVPLPEGVKDTPVNRMLATSKAVFDAGFDYLECGVGSLMGLSDEEYAELQESGFRLEACNGFIPGHLPICGFGEELEAYVEKALARVAGVGGKVVVFGSGKARTIPEGTSVEEGMEEIKRFLRMCEIYAAKNDVTIVIEPLNSRECNVLNYVSEGDALAKEVNLPHVANLADSYHVYQGNEPMENLVKCGALIKHAHIAEGDTRKYPGTGDGVFLTAFAKALKEGGYDGRVSAECGFSDFRSESKSAADYMRALFA